MLKEALEEERESVATLLKQKLYTENSLDAANAHIGSLTQAAGVYEAKLSEATDRLLGLTKQQVCFLSIMISSHAFHRLD